MDTPSPHLSSTYKGNARDSINIKPELHDYLEPSQEYTVAAVVVIPVLLCERVGQQAPHNS